MGNPSSGHEVSPCLKLLYVANSAIPSRSANSINVMKMCAAFSVLGHDVSMLTPDRQPTEPGVRNIYAFYGVEQSFRAHVLPWWGVPGRSYVYAIRAAFEARRRQVRFVYTRFVRGAVACAWLGIPVVYEVHAPPADAGKADAMLFRRLIGSRRLRRVVAISDALRAHLQRKYPELENRLLVAHDAADVVTESHSGTVSLRGRTGCLNVGYVGHLYEGKGMELIARIARQCPWADFHVVGGMAADIDRWSKELRGTDNVHFYGHVPHGQTPGYLVAFDVLLAPYQRRVTVLGHGDISSWMSPLKIFEYMAAGKPIVCSDLPVLREVFHHDKTAIFCDPEEDKAWVAALERLSQDASLRARLGGAAKKVLVEQYSWTERARRVLAGLRWD